MILLDTHAAVWLANDDPKLGVQTRSMILAAQVKNALGISAITFWEIALLVVKGRLQLREAPNELRDELLRSGVIELPLTGRIALLSVALDRLHGDPADRFIAATAIVHEATLVTADVPLLRWRHKLRRQNALK